jgi:hypothetical protein
MAKDKTKSKFENNNEMVNIEDLFSQAGVDINLNLKIVEFIGKIDDIKDEMLQSESMTLYYTIRAMIEQIFEKASSRLLDAKYLASMTKLIETADKILQQNRTPKVSSVVKSTNEIQSLTEEDIIRMNREAQKEEFESIQ